MRGEIITLHIGGAVTRKPCDSVENFDALQAVVGGDIGLVPGFDMYEGAPCDAYVNDEGLHLGLPENPAATRLWLAQFAGGAGPARGRLHGPVAVMVGDEAFMRASREF